MQRITQRIIFAAVFSAAMGTWAQAHRTRTNRISAEEVQIIQRLKSTVPEFEKDLKFSCKVPIKLEVDWDSFNTSSAVQSLQYFAIEPVLKGLDLECDTQQKRVAAKVQKITIRCLADGSAKSMKLAAGVLAIAGPYGEVGVPTPSGTRTTSKARSISCSSAIYVTFELQERRAMSMRRRATWRACFGQSRRGLRSQSR